MGYPQVLIEVAGPFERLVGSPVATRDWAWEGSHPVWILGAEPPVIFQALSFGKPCLTTTRTAGLRLFQDLVGRHVEVQCFFGGKSGLTSLFGAEHCFWHLASGEMFIQGPLGAQFPATPRVGTDVVLGP